MPFPISSDKYENVDWNALKNRPPIDPNNFCTEQNWFEDSPCCMSGYEIEHVLHIAHDNGFGDSPEVEFLNKYPCLNGVELDIFFERFTTQSNIGNNIIGTKTFDYQNILFSFIEGIKNIFR